MSVPKNVISTFNGLSSSEKGRMSSWRVCCFFCFLAVFPGSYATIEKCNEKCPSIRFPEWCRVDVYRFYNMTMCQTCDTCISHDSGTGESGCPPKDCDYNSPLRCPAKIYIRLNDNICEICDREMCPERKLKSAFAIASLWTKLADSKKVPTRT